MRVARFDGLVTHLLDNQHQVADLCRIVSDTHVTATTMYRQLSLQLPSTERIISVEKPAAHARHDTARVELLKDVGCHHGIHHSLLGATQLQFFEL